MLVTWGYSALLKAYRCILRQLSCDRLAYRAHKGYPGACRSIATRLLHCKGPHAALFLPAECGPIQAALSLAMQSCHLVPALFCFTASTMRIALPACRKVQNVDAVPDFPQRVLAAMHEGQERQRRLEPEADSWSMPSYALFALQRQGWVSGPVMFCMSYQSLRCQAKCDQWFVYACVYDHLIYMHPLLAHCVSSSSQVTLVSWPLMSWAAQKTWSTHNCSPAPAQISQGVCRAVRVPASQGCHAPTVLGLQPHRHVLCQGRHWDPALAAQRARPEEAHQGCIPAVSMRFLCGCILRSGAC